MYLDKVTIWVLGFMTGAIVGAVVGVVMTRVVFL